MPWFKFWTVQCFNILLLAALLTISPCVDIHNLASGSCFADSDWDTEPLFSTDLVNGDIDGDMHAAARRILGGKAKRGASAEGNSVSDMGNTFHANATQIMREGLYVMTQVYAISDTATALHALP